MAKKEKCPPCKQIVPEFMATYGDMVTLVLCFFVLLFAMMTPDAKRFELAASSFQQAFNGVLTSLPTVAIHQEVLTPRLGGDAQNKRIAADAATKIREVAAKENMEEAVKVDITDTGIAIRISNQVSFDAGSDRLKPEFIKILEEMMDVIRESPGREIRVEGHTDNTPISTAKFPSNWELSSSRALAVVKYLYQQGEDPQKLSGVGYGEFRPIYPNDTDVHKRENRRIEVYIEYLEKVNK
jgi:chemotaxis protein MotB